MAAIRGDILQRAQESDWIIDEAQLTDQAIIRRMVLKRCIYGVDKNPLTVELAKVSLWLHSFTVGAPLSFLDHHLRCGDSLVGLRVLEATHELNRLSGLFASSAIAGAENAAIGMQHIEKMSDADISEVQQSAALFQEVEASTADLRGLLDFLSGMRWYTAGMKVKERTAYESPLVETLGQMPEDAYKLLSRGPNTKFPESADAPAPSGPTFKTLWDDGRSVADREGFLHWEAAFPGVWRHWQDIHPRGGFDAVIGNPPWDQIEQPEVEWFALRDDEVALASTGATRKAVIEKRLEEGDKLTRDYIEVRSRASSIRSLLRSSGVYPLLSGGRINLYSLFVERAKDLIKPDGFVGLLTPSGIYADLTAAPFFKSISTAGRVASLFDFENRRPGINLPPFFPDVDSRFKFCALIVGGEKRRFDKTQCAFFLHDTQTIKDPDRCFPLEPSDFARVNPNTGTAPIFRTRRDAEITRRIYERHSVLVNRPSGEERRTYPAKYVRMFDMSNDSHRFRTAEQLNADDFYPVEGNRWKRGQELYLPLYQGRTIHQFDHRANSVRVNPDSIHNRYLSEPATDNEHADPSFLPRTQYWVPFDDVEPVVPMSRSWSIGFRDIVRPTDVRTMIASAIPQVGCGHTLPILLPTESNHGATSAACLLSNLNSFVFDYIARQKVQGTHLTWYTVEQLPVIAPAS